MGINDSGRKKLTIVKVLEKRKVGNAEVQEFTAKIESEETNAKYGVWSRALDEYIKPDTTIDCDVVTKKSEKLDPESNPYVNRKVTQIYLDGKPVIEQTGFQIGRYSPQPNNTASIEAQTAIKEIGECWRVGKLKDDDILVTACYRPWITRRLSHQPTSSTPDKQATVTFTNPADSQQQEKQGEGLSPDGSKASADQLSQMEKKPILAQALLCKDGPALGVFAGKHGISMVKFFEVVGCNPVKVTSVEAAARALFG